MDYTKFKNSGGNWLLRNLFYEVSTYDDNRIMFTLKDHDHKGYLSLYRLYMEMEDPTEYEFANTYLGGWVHWELLCRASWFIPYVTRWRLELDLKMKSQAIKKIKEVAKQNSPNMFQANKMLIERAWEAKTPKTSTKRGRPSTEEVQGELNRVVEEERQIDEDWNRLVNNKGE